MFPYFFSRDDKITRDPVSHSVSEVPGPTNMSRRRMVSTLLFLSRDVIKARNGTPLIVRS
ncbi:hypothetical protein Sp245p_28840 (plasmid) [Azospirillum baldaniorum]|uniref:Uncharacterized protein n=1 Tax=Azospirillum baldaniorum TaxID=1064539 RepID=A0A9P1NQJ1_9PROT|nr:hypothetical protein Sp245p_28840 [Azospirillum baldaniorum]CCD01987.1 protein of unknown function [Azospirillum baldaniorum]